MCPLSLLALFFILASAACAADGEDGDTVARIDTTAEGRVEVANTGVPTWTTDTAWRLEEDLRLGTAGQSGPQEEQFGSVVSVTADSRGRIYVLDWLSQEIRVFLPDGTFSHLIGGHGRGPGELLGAWDMSIGAGDTLTVLDDGTMRYSVFAPDGTLVESHPRSIVGYGSPLQTRLRDGSYIDWALESPDGRLGPQTLFYPIRLTPDFSRVDTFPPIRHAHDMVEGGRMRLMNFGSFVVAAPDVEGRIWFAESDEYRIHRRSLEGDTTLVFSLPVEPVPLGEAERDQVRERWARRPELRAVQLEALPETRPVVHGIVPDNRGHVFLFPDVADEPSGSVIDVFRTSGEYLGRLTLPTPVNLDGQRPPVAHVTHEYLYVVVTDEMDVPYVSRHRIVRGH